MTQREIIISSLNKRGYNPMQISNNKFTFPYISKTGDYILSNLIHNPDTNILVFQGIIPFDIKEQYKLEMLYFINHTNRNRPFARFLYVEEIERIVVESSMNLKDIGQLSEQWISILFQCCYKLINMYIDSIRLINEEGVGFLEAFNFADTHK